MNTRTLIIGIKPPAVTDWSDRAECAGVDPDLFFPERGASLAAARQVCAVCPVRRECLQYALDAGEMHGIWGGLSEKERRRIRRTRNEARRSVA